MSGRPAAWLLRVVAVLGGPVLQLQLQSPILASMVACVSARARVCLVCVCASACMRARSLALCCCVVCAGREVAGGSHRYADVQRLWQVLFVALRDRGPAAAASAGQYYGVLSLVLDCGAALQRAGGQQQGGYGAWGAGAGAARGNDDFDNYMQGGSRKRNR